MKKYIIITAFVIVVAGCFIVHDVMKGIILP